MCTTNPIKTMASLKETDSWMSLNGMASDKPEPQRKKI